MRLIKAATLPFSDDLSAQIYAARMLMLLFFAAAAVLAYLALSRLTPDRWIALTATLLAFSSPYCLYYSDMINPETVMDLFGVMLTFHGMVVFIQEDRFRQLLGKACAALLLGWHVFALLLTFIILGMASELVRAVSRLNRGGVESVTALRPSFAWVGRYLTLGVVPLLFGSSLLAFNFTNEYFALNGNQSWTDLPSFQSMLDRTGQNPDYNAQRADVCGRLRKCKPFLSLSFCAQSAPVVLRDSGAAPRRRDCFRGTRASLLAGPQGLPARSAAAVTRRAATEWRSRAAA